MTLDEAIKHCEEVAEEQSRLYSLCPCPCDGTKDCMSLENGKDLGCTKCAADHRQLAEWLAELKELKRNPFAVLKTACVSVTWCIDCKYTSVCPMKDRHWTKPCDWQINRDD